MVRNAKDRKGKPKKGIDQVDGDSQANSESILVVKGKVDGVLKKKQKLNAAAEIVESDTNNNDEKVQIKSPKNTRNQAKIRRQNVDPPASDAELFDDNNGKFYIFYIFFQVFIQHR